MLGYKKAKQIIQDIETIKCMIERVHGDIKDAGMITKFRLHQLMDPRDKELIRRMQANKELFAQAEVLFPKK